MGFFLVILINTQNELKMKLHWCCCISEFKIQPLQMKNWFSQAVWSVHLSTILSNLPLIKMDALHQIHNYFSASILVIEVYKLLIIASAWKTPIRKIVSNLAKTIRLNQIDSLAKMNSKLKMYQDWNVYNFLVTAKHRIWNGLRMAFESMWSIADTEYLKIEREEIESKAIKWNTLI